MCMTYHLYSLGGSDFYSNVSGLARTTKCFVSFLVLQSSLYGEERAGCFAIVVSLLLFFDFPGRVVGLYYVKVVFVIFPTFISWSYSLTFINNRVYGLFLDGWPIANFGGNVKIVSGYPAWLHLVLQMVLL